VLKQLLDRVLHGAGVTSPAERKAALDGTDQRAYLEKVRQHAYKVTDDDIAALRAAGMSEDAIYELTIAAALGVSKKRFDSAMEAIDAAR